MAEIHNIIEELGEDIKVLVKRAERLDPTRLGKIQQDAIISFQKDCRGLQGWSLGELKNAFGMGTDAEKMH